MGTAERVWAEVNRWMEALVRDAVELAGGIEAVGPVVSERDGNPFTATKVSDYASPSLRGVGAVRSDYADPRLRDSAPATQPTTNDNSTPHDNVLQKISDYCLEGLRRVLPKESAYASPALRDAARRPSSEKGVSVNSEPAEQLSAETTQQASIYAANSLRQSSSQLSAGPSPSSEVQRRRAMRGWGTTTHGYSGESGVSLGVPLRVAAEVGGAGGATAERGTTLAFHLDADPNAARNPNPYAALRVHPDPDQLWINNTRVY